ncbi:hypothetical protein M8J77_018228 [Diaphorina citri]|nr:hypothetical protein M8J77_018228 [Diaphorina citri]
MRNLRKLKQPCTYKQIVYGKDLKAVKKSIDATKVAAILIRTMEESAYTMKQPSTLASQSLLHLENFQSNSNDTMKERNLKFENEIQTRIPGVSKAEVVLLKKIRSFKRTSTI